MPHRALSLTLLITTMLPSCVGLPGESYNYNPIGWPAKALATVGFYAADSGWPLVRETGRLIQATGELIDAPALLVEGLVTADGDRLLSAGQHLLVGTGSTATATWNLPFFVMPGSNIDLGLDVERVNQALAYIESRPPGIWHTSPDDPRTYLFPTGTRARASGQNLIFTVPGFGEVLQSCEASAAWNLMQWAAGTQFPAQERSWGFVVPSANGWNSTSPRQRTKTILHEFYHQHMQIRQWLQGWSMVYWPAYMLTFPFTGWHGHWAEMSGPHAAGAVNRALMRWRPKLLTASCERGNVVGWVPGGPGRCLKRLSAAGPVHPLVSVRTQVEEARLTLSDEMARVVVTGFAGMSGG